MENTRTQEDVMLELQDELECMDDNDLMYLWNTYCDDVNNYDDLVYTMYELDDLTYGMCATEILDTYKDIDTSDNYFKVGIYGVDSFNYVSSYIEIDDLAEWLVNDYDIQTNSACVSQDIQYLIDEYYEIEESELD